MYQKHLKVSVTFFEHLTTVKSSYTTVTLDVKRLILKSVKFYCHPHFRVFEYFTLRYIFVRSLNSHNRQQQSGYGGLITNILRQFRVSTNHSTLTGVTTHCVMISDLVRSTCPNIFSLVFLSPFRLHTRFLSFIAKVIIICRNKTRTLIGVWTDPQFIFVTV